MASPFQRTSSFDHPERDKSPHTHVISTDLPPHGMGAKIGPTHDDLERWYRVLNDLSLRESDGDVDHTQELEDLRDEIYAFLH